MEPDHNRCWFAGRVLAVKLEYGLTVYTQEAAALEAMLEGCRIEQVLRPTDRNRPHEPPAGPPTPRSRLPRRRQRRRLAPRRALGAGRPARSAT